MSKKEVAKFRAGNVKQIIIVNDFGTQIYNEQINVPKNHLLVLSIRRKYNKHMKIKYPKENDVLPK